MDFPFGGTSGEIEFKFRKLWGLSSGSERMFTLVEINIDMSLGASEQFDHIVALVIFELPSVDIVENVMIR